jgi:hypothetical protein
VVGRLLCVLRVCNGAVIVAIPSMIASMASTVGRVVSTTPSSALLTLGLFRLNKLVAFVVFL